jgi:hypothetical protein
LKAAISQDVSNYQDLLKVKASVDHKKHQHFEEDFHALVVLCYLKANQKKLLLPTSILGKNLFNSIMLFTLQNAMLSCMLYSMLYNEENEENHWSFARSYPVFIVKFPSAICLHFVLYPEVMQGMNIMKYANN